MLKRVVGRVVGVLFSFVVGLALVEGLLRLAVPTPQGNRRTGIEGEAATPPNRPDFRGGPEPGVKPAGVFRILVVGDSFSWGSGVHREDAFPHRLQVRLAARIGEERVQVVNWSRPGWNTVAEFRSVRQRWDLLAPDLVILAFVLNDAEPTALSARRRMRGPLARREIQSGASLWLHGHSRLYRLAWERIENTRQRRAFTAYYHSLFTGDHWQACRLALNRFERACQARAIPMVLVILPIFDSQFDESYPYLDLHRRVGATAEELGIEVLDLLDVYAGIDARRLAVEPFTDAHPNELAHRLAADRIADHLEAGRLLARGASI